MNKLGLVFSGILLSVSLFQRADAQISIIPEPAKMSQQEGTFLLPKSVIIEAPAGDDVKAASTFLKDRLEKSTGHAVTVHTQSATATIKFVLNTQTDAQLGKEGYHLVVSPKTITIRANAAAGLFYGAQTLVQLFPKEIESNTVAENVKWQSPCVNITDYPRFGWRGMMLDVSRHFFKKEDVKAYIDQISRYKFNIFHWHLTDDGGWRAEIKSLPNLTTTGSWNVGGTGYYGKFSPFPEDAPRTNGGFYTQEDIKEVIQYAKERFVNIMPEVDVPAHSLAAIASYPQLSCTPGAEKYKVYSGEAGLMTWTDTGIVAKYDNTMCPANEYTYVFLDQVFTEIAQLFPFEYIHIGGDEAAKNYWKNSPAIGELMKREKLKNMEEVQSYFEHRVVKIVESKGKKVMGWDELLEGGLAPGAAVMSWRSEKGGIEASKQKHDVVMSPYTFTYIDLMQGDNMIEQTVYATVRLEKTYKFDPVAAGADEKYIKGGQANLWTEQVPTLRHAQYMTWPRAFAVSESVWSPKAKKNWNTFIPKVEEHFKRFKEAEINYAPSMYDPIFKVEKDPKTQQVSIALSTEIEGLDIYYTMDNTFPDRFALKYVGPIIPPKDVTQLKIITYRGKEPIGRLVVAPIKDLSARAK